MRSMSLFLCRTQVNNSQSVNAFSFKNNINNTERSKLDTF